jgi:hypothetical protein
LTDLMEHYEDANKLSKLSDGHWIWIQFLYTFFKFSCRIRIFGQQL